MESPAKYIWISLPFIIVAVYLFSFLLEKRRSNALQQQAARRGFSFSASGSLSSIDGFKCMSHGHSHRVNNVATKRYGDVEIKLFDYRYVTGRGKNKSVHRMSVCQLRDPELRLPSCFVRRQSAILDRIGSMFGGQDINFDQDPEFSKAFVLQGDDEQDTRSLFSLRLRRVFSRFAGQTLMFECIASSLCLHRRKRFRPNKIYQLVTDLREFHQAIKREHSSS